MKHVIILSISLAALLLTACSRGAPVVATSPVAVTAVQSEPTTSSGIGGLGGFSGMGGEPTAAVTPTPSATYTVQRGMIEDVLEFNAQIAPVQSTMAFGQDGIIKQILVKPGQTVNKGDLVASLDISDLQSQLNEATLVTEQAQSQISQVAQTSKLAVEQAQIALDAAQSDLEEIKQPPTALEIAQAQAIVRQAQANLDTVRNNASQAKNQAKAAMDKAVVDLQNLQEEYAKAVTRLQKAIGEATKELEVQVQGLAKQLHDAEAALAASVINYDTARNNEVSQTTTAEAQLDLAQAQLNDLLDGPDQFEIAAKERAVRSAEIVVAQARQSAVPDSSLLKALEVGRLQIQQIQEQIAARQLYAPIGGDVASINANIGDPIQIGSPVVTLVDRSQIDLVASGTSMLADNRTTLPTLSTNQAVEITFSRYPDKTFAGTISQVPPVGTATIDSTYHFSFDAQNQTFAPGDFAELKIVLGRKYDVLYLPPAAIQTSRSGSSVTLRSGDMDTRVDVLVGIATPDKVEILSGLNEGDLVVGK